MLCIHNGANVTIYVWTHSVGVTHMINEQDLLRIIEEEYQAIEEKKKKKAKRDACYHKVKARYDVWPSAYASGALVKCRKVGAANWGKSTKKENLELNEEEITDEESEKLKDIKKELDNASKMHKSQADRIEDVVDEGQEGGLDDWFKGGGWVDCNTCRKDKKTGRKKCKPCGRKEGSKRDYPACRPSPSKCSDKGRGSSWGKKSAKNEAFELTQEQLDIIVMEEYNAILEKKKKKKKKKKPCKPSKGKRFAKRVDGKCRSYGQAGQAKGGGDRIRPGTKKGDAYCARSAKIKKCKNPPCANDLSRKKWKCRGSKSMKE